VKIQPQWVVTPGKQTATTNKQQQQTNSNNKQTLFPYLFLLLFTKKLIACYLHLCIYFCGGFCSFLTYFAH
jgi:hypothetical protein